jgi:hypothetical protein
MAPTASLAVVGQGGTVLWGTTNVTLPTSGTAATTGLNDLGYLDEDGLTVSVTPTIQDLNVWQSVQPIRRALQSQTIALSGKFAEHNTHTVPRTFGGGTLSALASPGGTYAFIDPVVQGLEEFAVCADVTDGGTDRVRYCFARVNQTEAAEVTYNRNALAVLPFSFGVLAPAAGGAPGTAYVLNT